MLEWPMDLEKLARSKSGSFLCFPSREGGFDSRILLQTQEKHPGTGNVIKLVILVAMGLHKRMSASGNGCTFSVK